MKLKENFTIRKVAGRNVLVPFFAAAAAGKKMSVAEISGSSVWLLDQLKGREFSFGEDVSLPEDVDWEKVFADAGVNGVSALCYDAVRGLPAEQQPPFGLMLRWDISSMGLQSGFALRREAASQFRELMAGKGLKMLLLKGESLAENYPVPALRECGDVDFVAVREDAPESGFRECVALASDLGLEVVSQPKHADFRYMDVVFECHNPEHQSGYNASHHRTFGLLNSSLKDAVLRGDGSWELESVMQAVFTVKHMAQHLCYSGGKIALRMLLDLALLLQKHPDISDRWDRDLEYTGLKDFSDIVLCACDTLLGTRLSVRSDRRTVRRTERFIRLFLTESNRPVRFFAKFGYLPLTWREVLGICMDRIRKTAGL